MMIKVIKNCGKERKEMIGKRSGRKKEEKKLWKKEKKRNKNKKKKIM